MPDIIIREARAEDCGRMLELVKELAVYERAPDEVTVDPEHFRESGFGEKPVWWAYVAETDGFVVGFALYYVRFSTWKGQRMYLEDILVTEEWRCKGIGRMLMDQLIEVARERIFSGIMWQVLYWNEPSINFYRRYDHKFDSEWLNVSMELTHPA